MSRTVPGHGRRSLFFEWMNELLDNYHLTEIKALRQGALGLVSFDCGLGEQLQEENLKSQGSGHRVGKYRGKSVEDTHFSGHKNDT